MATFRKGKFNIQTNKGPQEVEGWIASNGLAIQGSGSGRRGHYTITHMGSGLGFSSWVNFNELRDAKRFVSEVEGVKNFRSKDINPKPDDLKAIRAAFLRVMPERQSASEREEETRARNAEELRKQDQARREREDYGHHDYRGSGYTKKGRLVKYDRLNKYDINAQNRKKQKIAHAEATGSKAMHRARKRIYDDKRTWLKFQTYNRTRGRWLKG